MPFMRRRPLLRAAAVGGVAHMGAKAGTNQAMQQQGAVAPRLPHRNRPRPRPRHPRLRPPPTASVSSNSSRPSTTRGR